MSARVRRNLRTSRVAHVSGAGVVRHSHSTTAFESPSARWPIKRAASSMGSWNVAEHVSPCQMLSTAVRASRCHVTCKRRPRSRRSMNHSRFDRRNCSAAMHPLCRRRARRSRENHECHNCRSALDRCASDRAIWRGEADCPDADRRERPGWFREDDSCSSARDCPRVSCDLPRRDQRRHGSHGDRFRPDGRGRDFAPDPVGLLRRASAVPRTRRHGGCRGRVSGPRLGAESCSAG